MHKKQKPPRFARKREGKKNKEDRSKMPGGSPAVNEAIVAFYPKGQAQGARMFDDATLGRWWLVTRDTLDAPDLPEAVRAAVQADAFLRAALESEASVWVQEVGE